MQTFKIVTAAYPRIIDPALIEFIRTVARSFIQSHSATRKIEVKHSVVVYQKRRRDIDVRVNLGRGFTAVATLTQRLSARHSWRLKQIVFQHQDIVRHAIALYNQQGTFFIDAPVPTWDLSQFQLRRNHRSAGHTLLADESYVGWAGLLRGLSQSSQIRRGRATTILGNRVSVRQLWVPAEEAQS